MIGFIFLLSHCSLIEIQSRWFLIESINFRSTLSFKGDFLIRSNSIEIYIRIISRHTTIELDWIYGLLSEFYFSIYEQFFLFYTHRLWSYDLWPNENIFNDDNWTFDIFVCVFSRDGHQMEFIFGKEFNFQELNKFGRMDTD